MCYHFARCLHFRYDGVHCVHRYEGSDTCVKCGFVNPGTGTAGSEQTGLACPFETVSLTFPAPSIECNLDAPLNIPEAPQLPSSDLVIPAAPTPPSPGATAVYSLSWKPETPLERAASTLSDSSWHSASSLPDELLAVAGNRREGVQYTTPEPRLCPSPRPGDAEWDALVVASIANSTREGSLAPCLDGLGSKA